MIGALLLGLVAGAVARTLMPGDPFSHLSGPKSWGLSILLGFVGAFFGYLVFTRGMGIGDDDIFDFGGIIGAIIGTMIVLPIASFILRMRARRS